MPVDTANKRGSAISTAEIWMLVAPVPDAAFNQADRQQIAWSYAGILAGAPPIPSLPFRGDAYLYDESAGTGSITGGTIINPDVIYD